jgi:hypothetical protein
VAAAMRRDGDVVTGRIDAEPRATRRPVGAEVSDR